MAFITFEGIEWHRKILSMGSYLIWALALGREMGPHKGREKLWPWWDSNARPSNFDHHWSSGWATRLEQVQVVGIIRWNNLGFSQHCNLPLKSYLDHVNISATRSALIHTAIFQKNSQSTTTCSLPAPVIT